MDDDKVMKLTNVLLELMELYNVGFQIDISFSYIQRRNFNISSSMRGSMKFVEDLIDGSYQKKQVRFMDRMKSQIFGDVVVEPVYEIKLYYASDGEKKKPMIHEKGNNLQDLVSLVKQRLSERKDSLKRG